MDTYLLECNLQHEFRLRQLLSSRRIPIINVFTFTVFNSFIVRVRLGSRTAADIAKRGASRPLLLSVKKEIQGDVFHLQKKIKKNK